MIDWSRRRALPASSEFTSIGIVFAMDIESRGLKNVLSHSRRVRTKHSAHVTWQLGTVRVTAAVSGIGHANSADATAALIDIGARTIINAGFAASLDGKAAVGDVVVVDNVLMADTPSSRMPCDHRLCAALPPSGSLGYGIWKSDIVTTDTMILAPEEKRLMYASTGAAALDMECYAAAQTCNSLGIPFMSVKAVSDTSSDDLPIELRELLKLHSSIGQALFVVKRPTTWRRLWRLRKHAVKASDNLGDALGMMLLRLSRC